MSIDYTAEDFVAATRKPCFRTASMSSTIPSAGDVLRRSYRVLRQGGFLVSIVDTPPPDEAARVGVQQAFVFVAPNGGQLRQLAALIDSGRIRPPAITRCHWKKRPTRSG